MRKKYPLYVQPLIWALVKQFLRHADPTSAEKASPHMIQIAHSGWTTAFLLVFLAQSAAAAEAQQQYGLGDQRSRASRNLVEIQAEQVR